MAVGIANGEATFPGYFIDITEVKVNGEAIELGKDFTTTDDGIVTRSNIWNEWVTDIPAEARVADGDLEGVTAKIATAEALSGIKTIDVTFDYIYGVPPVVETEKPLTEDEVKELTSKTYGAYIAVQSDPNYISATTGRNPPTAATRTTTPSPSWRRPTTTARLPITARRSRMRSSPATAPTPAP